MIIYLVNPKTGRDDTNNPVELPNHIERAFDSYTESMEHNNITYERSIHYHIMSPYGWRIKNDSNKEIRN